MKKHIFMRMITSFAIIFLLISCQSENNEDESISLHGESETWALNGYTITFSNDETFIGDGTLNMKTNDEYMSNFFHFQTHFIMNNEDEVVHSGSVGGDKTNITGQTTGTIERGPLVLDDINEIYMTVEWWDNDLKKDRKERINLYPRKS